MRIIGAIFVLILSVATPPNILADAAIDSEGAEDGCEDSDDELNDFFPGQFFHNLYKSL